MVLPSRETRPFGPVSFDQPRGSFPREGCVLPPKALADAKTWGAFTPPHYLLAWNPLLQIAQLSRLHVLPTNRKHVTDFEYIPPSIQTFLL